MANGRSSAVAQAGAVAVQAVGAGDGGPVLDGPHGLEAVAEVDAIDALLPQTQCTRCGYPDCRAYAVAIATAGAAINRCPPGGEEGIARLAALTGRAAQPLDPACGHEGPRLLAVIDEAWCIGCTLCIKACPVDCVVGANKRMHTVVDADCTGCELCVPACPVDCISLVPVSDGRTGWQAWSPAQAQQARAQYRARDTRRARLQAAHETRLAAKAAAKLADLPLHSRLTDPAALARKRSVIEAALARARAGRALPPHGDAETATETDADALPGAGPSPKPHPQA